MNLTRTLATTLTVAILLQGCASQLKPPPAPPAVTESTPSATPEAVKVPEKPFPIETFYALLVAEIAGSRERYDIALGNYMQQAQITRDPDIAARATRIARFLNVRRAALESALLWAEVSPTDAEAHFIAASELIQAGRLLEASQHSAFLLQNDGSTLYQSIASRATSATDTQRELLLAEFLQRLAEHPANTDLLVGVGLLYQQQQQPEQALTYVRQALQLDATLVSAAVLEARLLNDQGQPEEAMKRLRLLLDAHPDNDRLRLQYARLLASIDLDEAYQQFSILVQQSPHDEDFLLSLALISHERGLVEEARQHFESLTRFERHSSVAHYYLGRIAEASEDWQVALEHYLRVGPGPNFIAALLRTTDILVRAGQTEAANKRLSAARQQFPQEAERLYLLEAEVLNKYQQLHSAHSLLNEALALFPASTQLLYSRAMISEQLDRLEDLERDLRAVLKYDPNNAAALNALGYTLADRTTRYQEALELISQALQIKPEDPAILDSMGWVQYRLGNLPEALLLLRQAMQAYPDHEIAAHLGEVLWVSGRQQEAREVWSKGLKLNPKSTVIADVIRRLGALPAPGDTP